MENKRKKYIVAVIHYIIIFIIQINNLYPQEFIGEITVNVVPPLLFAELKKSDDKFKKVDIGSTVQANFELGERYVQLNKIPYSVPICIMFDYSKIRNDYGIAVKLGHKSYIDGLRGTYNLKGSYSIPYYGLLYTKSKNEGKYYFNFGFRNGYKFTLFNLIIIEPFIDQGFAIFSGYISNTQVGINSGIRF